MIDDAIQDFISYVTKNWKNEGLSCLSFWKTNEERWPALATLAKRLFSVPATSANVERMFSVSGHIFSSKRGRIKNSLFESLVFTKLNEQLI